MLAKIERLRYSVPLYMETLQHTITLDTHEPIEFIDLTDKAASMVKASGIKNGFVLLSSRHTTCALCINESCDRLQSDMKDLFNKLAPKGDDYRHNHETIDGRSNAHSHLLSLLLRTTETVQIVDKKLDIGTWQRIFFIELDGPRNGRSVSLMMVGKK